MWILPLVGFLGLLAGFLLLTLAIASGLYALSELVEEHTVVSKRLLYRLIYAVMALHLLLAAVDRFPAGLSLFSIASHGVYSLNLRRFPVVKLTEPVFVASCLLVVANHWLWYRHFSNPPPTPFGTPGRYSYHQPRDMPTFTEIASFFGLNVWLVPFALFVSLSAGENVLPSMGSEYATGPGSSFVSPGRDAAPGPSLTEMNGDVGRFRTRRRRGNTQSGMAKQAVAGVRDWVGETGELMGFWKGDETRPL